MGLYINLQKDLCRVISPLFMLKTHFPEEVQDPNRCNVGQWGLLTVCKLIMDINKYVKQSNSIFETNSCAWGSQTPMTSWKTYRQVTACWKKLHWMMFWELHVKTGNHSMLENTRVWLAYVTLDCHWEANHAKVKYADKREMANDCRSTVVQYNSWLMLQSRAWK